MLALSVLKSLGDHLGLIVGAAIVLVGLIGLGFADVIRFSPRRVMAIASVCFRQSIRRRVLWITPLVVLGIIVVSQFMRPVDAQDAIRQTTGYCLFATGMLLTLVIVVLACTNLPREIESRVIYTIATKPTTRLEIIVGKVVGFAGVSACILVIMGIFTAGYLHWQDWRSRSLIRRQLQAGNIDKSGIPTFTYYAEKGMLHAREMGLPSDLNIYAHMPAREDDHWIQPGRDGEIHARFIIDPTEIPAPAPGRHPLYVQMTVSARRVPGSNPATLPTTLPTTRRVQLAMAPIDLMNARGEALITWPLLVGITNDRNRRLPRAIHDEDVIWPGGTRTMLLPLELEFIEKWLIPEGQESGPMEAYISVTGGPEFEYRLDSIRLLAGLPGEARKTWNPPTDPQTGEPDISYIGRTSQFGQQLKGPQENSRCVAIYEFRDLRTPAGPTSFSIELKSIIEANRADDREEYNLASIQFKNRKSGYLSPEIEFNPESSRPSYVDVPAEAVSGGDFDAYIRMKSGGWMTLRAGNAPSLRLVLGDHSFIWNLAKSLTILWLLSVLMTIVAIFCSTFLSWPIAVVLTLVILSGRWGTEQLGDMLKPGVGNQIANDLFRGAGARTTRVVSQSVDALTEALTMFSSVLPDISQFAAIEGIQRGVAIPPATLLSSLMVSLGFGLPLLVLSYVFLKYKEVAP